MGLFFFFFFFCGAVTESSHPGLVREREIDWERRGNWHREWVRVKECDRERCHPRSLALSEQVARHQLNDTAPTFNFTKQTFFFFSLVKRLFRVFVDFGKRQQKNRGVCNFPVEKETEIQVSGAPLLDWSKVLSALNRVNCGSFALQGLNSLNSSFDSAFELNNGEKYNAREKFPVLLRQ